jgi:hypothetical protein
VWSGGAWRALGAGGVTVIASGERHAFEPGSAIEGLPQPAA